MSHEHFQPTADKENYGHPRSTFVRQVCSDAIIEVCGVEVLYHLATAGIAVTAKSESVYMGASKLSVRYSFCTET